MKKPLWFLPAIILWSAASTSWAHPVEQDMADAAKAFLATLSPEQIQK
ncbi:MAG: hypothetical protein RLZZ399_1244, partial [Verrucomicrobiota bacterium]